MPQHASSGQNQSQLLILKISISQCNLNKSWLYQNGMEWNEYVYHTKIYEVTISK